MHLTVFSTFNDYYKIIYSRTMEMVLGRSVLKGKGSNTGSWGTQLSILKILQGNRETMSLRYWEKEVIISSYDDSRNRKVTTKRLQSW